MTRHLQRQIDKLKDRILVLGTMVENAVKNAINAVENRDVQMAQNVIDGDKAIDMMEVEVEEECLSTFALHQFEVSCDTDEVVRRLTITVCCLIIHLRMLLMTATCNNVFGSSFCTCRKNTYHKRNGVLYCRRSRNP